MRSRRALKSRTWWTSQIDEAWLENATTIGVTSGASVPEILVTEVVKFLDERGYSDVEEVTTTVETITFALPRDLRAPRAKATS